MKPVNTLMIFTALLFAAPVAAQKEDGGKKRKQEFNETDEFGRKQGTWQFFDGMGDLVLEIEFKNDKREGITKNYYTVRSGDSKVRDETNYLDGKRDGDFKKYFPTGEPSMEGSYDMGKKDGKWTRYYEDGSTRWEGTYKKGLKDGEWKFYDRKGNLKTTIAYKDGVDLQAQANAEKAAAEKKAAEKKKSDAAGKAPAASNSKK